jgi:hypothetical protein
MSELADAALAIVAIVMPLLSAEVLRRMGRVERTLDTLPCRAALPLGDPDKKPAKCLSGGVAKK